jgi:hypothetical protein
MKWRAFGRMPQWVRLSEWLGIIAGRYPRIVEKKLAATLWHGGMRRRRRP